MSQLLTLSRAAHLIGVSRGVLQKRIREGELCAQDGMVASADLLRLYPELDLEESGAFERITRIKEQSFGRRVRERMLPSQEILAQRLVEQSGELADLRRHLARYHELLATVRERLDQTAGVLPGRDELAQLIDQGLGRVLGSADLPDAVARLDDMLRVVSARVTLRPSGREFQIEGNDSVLKGALKAGLAPSYGCGNGNCGLCKARVVSGEVRPVQAFDYVLSAAEKAQNYTLLCSHTAVTDLVVEALEAESPADIPEQQLVARVKRITVLDAQTRQLHIQTPRSQRLRFFAGQSVTLGIAGGTADFGGDYPIASCPCDDRNLLFHIGSDMNSGEGGDEFAQRLFADAIKPGDPINVRGPWGEFVLQKDATRPLLFACCDRGFAPVNSLIEHALSVAAAESITLCWAATRVDGHYAARQCRAWAEALDDFIYRPVSAADPADAANTLFAGLNDSVALAACDIYVAGPAAFVAALQKHLAGIGIPVVKTMPTA